MGSKRSSRRGLQGAPRRKERPRPAAPPRHVPAASRHTRKQRQRGAGGKAMSGETGPTSVAPPPGEIEPGSGVRIVVEYCEPCGFEATYLELASAVKEQYPGIEIESRLGGTGAFEIEINGQLVFSKLENGGFPYEKDLIEAIRRASNGEPLEKITNSRPPCVIL
uniref:Migration and invasion enhancer 1 n=4 Tax=Artiodactyla TaxID=91561 RepID=A0A8D0WUE3_PIG